MLWGVRSQLFLLLHVTCLLCGCALVRTRWKMAEFVGVFESFSLDLVFTSLTRHYMALKFCISVWWNCSLFEKFEDEVRLPFVDLKLVGMVQDGKFGLRSCAKCRGVSRIVPYEYYLQEDLVRIGPCNDYDMPSSYLWERHVGAYRCVRPSCQRMFLFVNIRDPKEKCRRMRKGVPVSLQFMLPFPTELYSVNRTLEEIDSGEHRPEGLRIRSSNIFKMRRRLSDLL